MCSSDLQERRVGRKARERLDGLLVPPSRRELADGSDDEARCAESRAKRRGRAVWRETGRIHDRRVERSARAEPPGDRLVGECERVGSPEEEPRRGTPPDLSHVVKRSSEPHAVRAGGERGEDVVMGRVCVHDIELFAGESFRKAPRVPKVVERAARAGQQRARPAEGVKPLGERGVGRERELGFHAGLDHRGRLLEDDGGRPGPLLAGHDLEDAHEETLSGPLALDSRAMAVDPELLAILVCPKTKGPLELVELKDSTRKALVEKYREKFRDEEPVVTQGLYSREADLVYPIVSDIPVMLVEEALPGSEAR